MNVDCRPNSESCSLFKAANFFSSAEIFLFASLLQTDLYFFSGTF